MVVASESFDSKLFKKSFFLIDFQIRYYYASAPPTILGLTMHAKWHLTTTVGGGKVRAQ